ncbi:hypothetical protein N9483_03065 [Flavobacteriaceae bacterium]|nr:hypothetical protein [Flavobacteriaceae bacterium]
MRNTISKFFLLTIGLIISSCTSVSEKDLTNLNGYWEIEKVESNGETFTPRGGAILVDFYQLDSTTGYRKKLAPSFNGNYKSSEDQFNFSVVNIEGSFYIEYKEALQPWKEKIISINATQLELEHSDKTYVYKRHEKISL